MQGRDYLHFIVKETKPGSLILKNDLFSVSYSIWASLVAQRLKHLPCNAGDLGLIPGSGRSPGEGNGNPLQYSCLENPMDGGAWWATVHGVTKSQTRLSNFTFFHFASWKKSYDQPRQHILKQRHYFANKGPSSQSYGFPVVMYGCESWTIKKAEH